jgi:RimJ/RimL family protein N-acetyltransferase
VNTLFLDTPRLRLVLQTPDEALAWVESLPPEVRAEVSPAWLAAVRALDAPDPWRCGFTLFDRVSGTPVGGCAFKAPPDADGLVEIAYGVDEPHRGRGLATEAAAALVRFALEQPGVRGVRAHTRADNPASMRILEKCGLAPLGEVVDPEDGPVLRWELQRPSDTSSTPGGPEGAHL